VNVPRLAPCLLVALAAASTTAQVRYRGMAYTAWNKGDYAKAESNLSLESMFSFGVDTVQINVWEFQETVTSTVIAPNYDEYSASPSSVRKAIQKAKSLGMKVMLKPIVDLSNDGDHWRADIVCSSAWNASYKAFVKRWARLAQQEHVDLFSVGCELTGTEKSGSFWRSVIGVVKANFTGLLTYSANYDTEQKITWWDALDLIGIDAYYELTNKKNPTLAELTDAWKARAAALKSWHDSKWPTKTIIFTEIGYRSTDGSNMRPWEWGINYGADPDEQRDCYKALLSVLWNEKWWGGAFWWNWETSPNAGGKKNQDYTPQYKPAQYIIKYYYTLK
jgi:hypothetical protein